MKAVEKRCLARLLSLLTMCDRPTTLPQKEKISQFNKKINSVVLYSCETWTVTTNLMKYYRLWSTDVYIEYDYKTGDYGRE